MKQQYLATAVVWGLCAGLAACGGKSPTAPAAPTITGVDVTFPAGGTIYIGAAPQLQATETLSDGTSRAVAALWSSDTPAVATVTQTGVVAAIGAGEANIAADANGRQGTLRIRVYPNFNGTWRGSESNISCDDSGAFDGLCSDSDFYTQGEVFLHDSRYTQTDAAVTTTLDFGGGMTASGPGTVSTGGELELTSARLQPEDPTIKVDLENIRFRSDVPTRLTGNYRIRFTVPGVDGFVLLGFRLEEVTRTSMTIAALSGSSGKKENVKHRIARMREAHR